MKKLAVIAAAAMLVFSVAGQAAAFFEDFNLIRTIYTTVGNTEIGSDLGPDVRGFAVGPYNTTWPGQPNDAGTALDFVPAGTNPVSAFVGDSVSLSLLAGGLSDLRVAYYAHGFDVKDFWYTGFLTNAYGGTDTDGLNMGARKQNVADGHFDATQGYYGGLGGETVIGAKTDVASYFTRFTNNGLAPGGGGGALADDSWEMEMGLGQLLTIGYVDQLLYWFDYNTSTSAKAGVEVAVIRTFLTSDGATIDLSGDSIATVVNPSAVPIPGSVLLLASGLLGIFGFRRKRA